MNLIAYFRSREALVAEIELWKERCLFLEAFKDDVPIFTWVAIPGMELYNPSFAQQIHLKFDRMNESGPATIMQFPMPLDHLITKIKVYGNPLTPDAKEPE